MSGYKRIFSNESRIRISSYWSSMWTLWFCDVTITPLAHTWLTDLVLYRNRACTLASASEVNITRILEEEDRLAYIALWCLAFISGLTCDIKVHWPWLIAVGMVCGIWPARLSVLARAWRPHSSQFVVDFKCFFKIVTHGPYIVTQCLYYEIYANLHYTKISRYRVCACTCPIQI